MLQLALDNVKARFLPGSTTYQTVQTQLDQVKKEIQQTTTAANKLPTAQRNSFACRGRYRSRRSSTRAC